MARPEAFQLPFDFSKQPERSLVTYESGLLTTENSETTSRFVRQVREEIQIHSPQDAAYHLMTNVYTPFDGFDQEEFWTLLLNTKNRITHEALVYRGTIDTIPIRQAELFKEAVRINARGLILSHNHPSGDPTPSPEDVWVTEQAVMAGRILGIELLDHIVVGRERFVSLKERGLGFKVTFP